MLDGNLLRVGKGETSPLEDTVIKRTPKLTRKILSLCWASSKKPWLCQERTDQVWNLKEFKKIKVVGSDKFTQGAYKCDPTLDTCPNGDLYYIPVFQRWLQSFNSPYVWIWIEEA